MKENFGSQWERKEIADQMEDYRAEEKDREKENIANRVLEIDRTFKALTGRRAEDYAWQSGVSLEDLFPEGKEILNVGDPWQTLDLEGVTSIDYEFGEEASFVDNEEQFLETTSYYFDKAYDNLVYAKKYDSGLSGGEHEVIEKLLDRLGEVRSDVEKVLPADYVPLANIFRGMHELISALHQSNDSAPDIREARVDLRDTWYSLVHLERGFRDSDLMRNVINPTLESEIIQSKLSHEEQERLKKQLIEQHRFVKRTKHARVMKATFPDVPFEPGSFDRIVASWSLSTHMFPEMSKQDFTIYWNKMDELLKRDGVAYLWPIYMGNEDFITESLVEYTKTGGYAELKDADNGEMISIRDTDEFRDRLYRGTTLIIHARKK